jgi:hypothetical protein
MADFPGHEAVVGVLLHWGDASFFPADLYVHNWGHPNQLQYALALPLACLIGTTRALEVVVALGVASIILGTARLARHLGRPEWVGVLAAPVAAGWSLHLGFIANLLGLGAFLWMLPELDGFTRDPRWRGAAGVLGGLVLLYFAHEAALVSAMLAIAVLSVAHGGSVARYALRAAPCIAAAGGAYLQLKLRHLTEVNRFGLAPMSLEERLHDVPWTTVGYYDFNRAPLVFTGIVLIVALNAARVRVPLLGEKRALSKPLPNLATRGAFVRFRFVALGLSLLLGYLVLPASYEGILFLCHRFLPVAWCVLIVATAAPSGARWQRAGAIACAGVPAVMLALLIPPLLDSDAAYRRLDALLPAIDRGAAVFSVEFDRGPLRVFNPRGFSTRFAQGHIVAQRGGRALADYTQSPISPALVNPAFAWQAAGRDNFLDPTMFHPAIVFAQFRYVMVHASAPELGRAVQNALRSEARLVAQNADWQLFESTILETRSLDVAEPTAPADAGDALLDRLRASTAIRPKR